MTLVYRKKGLSQKEINLYEISHKAAHELDRIRDPVVVPLKTQTGGTRTVPL